MQAIFFDLDGTLSDPYEGLARSLSFAFGELGLPQLREDEVRAMIGPPLQIALRERFSDAALVDAAVQRFRERYGTIGLYENVVYDGVPEMLAASRS